MSGAVEMPAGERVNVWTIDHDDFGDRFVTDYRGAALQAGEAERIARAFVEQRLAEMTAGELFHLTGKMIGNAKLVEEGAFTENRRVSILSALFPGALP